MSKMIERKKSQKGFTLIELIVVLAILVVLAAIALPTFNGLIEASKEAVSDANARTAYTAARAYVAMNPGEDFDGTGTAGEFTATHISAVEAFLGDSGITITKIEFNTDDEITKVTVTDSNGTGTYPAD